jgi:hypothetical protein
MELGFADHAKLKADGRNFNCADCPTHIQKLRRCREDREDFTEADGSVWPMYVEKGGELYGFCPSKATWDPHLAETFRLLVITSETGVMLSSGGIVDQPDWYVEALGWFLPRYQQTKLGMYAKSFLGDGRPKSKAGKALKHGNNPR